MKLFGNIIDDPVKLLMYIIVITGICIAIVIIILLYRLQNEKKIIQAALELRKITNSIRAGLVHFILEDKCRILYASKGFYEILGYDKNAVKEERKVTLMDFLDPRSNSFAEDIRQQLGNQTIRQEVWMKAKNGSSLYMLMNGNSSKRKDGKHTLSVVFLDISEQKRMQDINLLEGERYRVATELSNDVLFEYHILSDEMIHTEKFRDLVGTNPMMLDYVKSCALRRDKIHPDDWGIYLEFCQELKAGKSNIESQFRIKNLMGEYIWCQILGKTIYDEHRNPIRVLGKIVNVDTQKRELEALEYKATRDPLTGVYNKEITIKKIDKFISGNKNGMHMLMFIDFDNFKDINDRHGHLVGDKVLVFLVSRIKEIFSEGEIIGRIGGDEFVAFAGNISCHEEITERAKALRNALDTTYVSDNISIPISASVGIAIYPDNGLHYVQLMDRADKALYQVKKKGKNDYLLYMPSI